MKKLMVGLLVCVLLFSTVVAASASYSKKARIGEVVFDSWWHDDAVFHVNVYGGLDNDGDDARIGDNARITVWIPELHVYDVSRSFSVRDDGPDGKLVFVRIAQRPEAGWYLARFSLTGNNVRDQKWRLVLLE